MGNSKINARNGDLKLSVAELRTIQQAQQAQRREAKEIALKEFFSTRPIGHGIVVLTMIFSALSLAVSALPKNYGSFALAYDLAIFFISMVLFVVVMFLGILKSKTHILNLTSWWFLIGSSPKKICVEMYITLSIHVVLSIAIAVWSNTLGATFGTLSPLFTLVMFGFWGYKYGMYQERTL